MIAPTFEDTCDAVRAWLGDPQLRYDGRGHAFAAWWGPAGRHAGSLEVAQWRTGYLELVTLGPGMDGTVTTWVLHDPDVDVVHALVVVGMRLFGRPLVAPAPVPLDRALAEAMDWLAAAGIALPSAAS